MSHASEPHCVSEIELPSASRVYQPQSYAAEAFSYRTPNTVMKPAPCSTASAGWSNGASEMVTFQTGFKSESNR